MKLRLALVGLVALGGAALTAGNGIGHARSPLSDNPRLQTLRALLWFAARMVVSATAPVYRRYGYRRPPLWLWRASRLRIPSRLSPLVT